MNNDFSEQLSSSKKIAIKQLKKTLLQGKLDLIKAQLKSSNIPFDNNINDLNTLYRHLKKTLTNEMYVSSRVIIDTIEYNLDSVLDQLEKGSTTAFSNFINNVKNGSITPLLKGTVISLAARTALLLAPTPDAKIVTAGVVGTYTLNKLINNRTLRKKHNKEYECNKILQSMEIKRNNKGEIIDTRFDKNIQRIIKDFLSGNGIKFVDTGYLSLREVIYNLSISDKIKLCNIINNNMGLELEINEKLKKFDDGILTDAKNKLIRPIILGATGGTAVATTINSIDPAILAAPINGTALGTVLGNLSNSPVVGWLSGVIGGIGTAVGRYIPVVGEVLQKSFAIENMALLAILGASVGVVGVVGNSVYQTLRNISDKFKEKKFKKEILTKDAAIYHDDNAKEYQYMMALVNNPDLSSEEKLIFNIICSFMNELGINVNDINTLHDVEEKIKECNPYQKYKIKKLIEELTFFNKKNHNEFVKCMKKTITFAKNSLLVGMAGLSVYDLLHGGDFLVNLSDDIFNNGPVTLERVPELEALTANHGLSLKESPVSTTEPLAPQPLPGPSPAATPSPPDLTSSVQNTVNIETVKEVVDTSSIYQDILTNSTEFVTKLNGMSTDEIIKQIGSLGEPKYIDFCINSLSNDNLVDLVKYLNERPVLQVNDLSYQFIKDAIINKVTSANVEIASMEEAINLSRGIGGISSTIDNAATIQVPITGIIVDKEEKKKSLGKMK